MMCILSVYAPQTEEGVTQINLQKWEQQNRDRSADCQKLSAKQG